MDLIERLKDSVNTIDGLPVRCLLGYLKPEESFVVYPLPGSKVVRRYYDGIKDQVLNFEFAMKSKDQQKIHQTLWATQSFLEELEELSSKDGSFDFDGITVTNKPFITNLDDTGYYIFNLDVAIAVTSYK
ncbi:phage tail terminator protein [Enterococcus diestrammenae]|uniref:phage tail terminator protein n=1 Tax=Enterococcus diestrammenae TaxID=1155073 RepID=UPI0022E67482|nr:minor capsid protein [Enterococcus diestrammenae]